MSTSSRGIAAERYVARWLTERDWLVASRRHVGGAGDLLAISRDVIWLVEVKSCKNLWENFRREDREEMREAKRLYLPDHAELWVVNVRGKHLEWLPESAWL